MLEKQKFIDDMANRCRSSYVRERTLHESRDKIGPVNYSPGPRWDGGTDRQGHEHKPVWPKIAEFMIKHALDPETCIRMRFALRREISNKAVLPNQIALDKYVDEYRGDARSEGRSQQELQSLESEKDCFRGMVQLIIEDEGMAAKEAWKVVLLDETLSLSPLFRYCVATSEGLSNISEYYYQQAVTQYLCAPKEYSAVWDEWIPDKFKKDVESALNFAVKG